MINVVFLLVLICPLSHDVILNFELLRTVGKVASTFECELGCRCLYENGVSLQVSELCVYATYLVRSLFDFFRTHTRTHKFPAGVLIRARVGHDHSKGSQLTSGLEYFE